MNDPKEFDLSIDIVVALLKSGWNVAIDAEAPGVVILSKGDDLAETVARMIEAAKAAKS